MKSLSPDLEPFLGPLKDFQRRTVDYVFHRMYLDENPIRRFLVADEVGLGKTLVARGIIARVLHHLYHEVDRIDIIYVCSNAAIAQQNLNRLNVTGERDLAFATRLTLLPAQVRDLKDNRINLVSFTPGTTFDLKSRGGRKEERADIYAMLQGALDLPGTGFMNLLQCTASRSGWRSTVKNRAAKIDLDPGLAEEFARAVRKDRRLLRRLNEGCERFGRYRKNPPSEDHELRYSLIGELRRKLADMCIEALEPDLIILDEFQRFRDLLETVEEKQTEAASLAQDLMRYRDARVLLLSATPYKMLTLSQEEGEDHYEDFIDTVDFLLQDEDELGRLRKNFRQYRNHLLSVDGFHASDLVHTRDAIQSTLLSVMTRTERVDSTEERNAMVEDVIRPSAIDRPDLRQARLVDRIAQAVESYDPIEYWKSAPYLLNLMKGYKLKEDFEERLEDPPAEIWGALKEFPEQLLRREDVEAYRAIDPQNGRLRQLMADTVGTGQWKLLWMPPSLPYWSPTGVYEDLGSVTKSLIFSAWNVVPDVIAAVCSYAAERETMDGGEPIPYSELTVKRRGLLLFRVTADGPENMSTLTHLYPCVTLAREVDPLGIAIDLQDHGPVTAERVIGEAVKVVEARLRETGVWPSEPGSLPDQRWYWAAPVLLDRAHAPDVEEWLSVRWPEGGPGQRGGTGFEEHARLLARTFREPPDLGPAPDDLPEVLARMALGAPAICALRSLGRITGSDRLVESALLDGAVEMAEGFRSLFNNPESVLLLRGGDSDTPYWRAVIDYAIDGNLQAMLDEYLHVLKESLGLVHHPTNEVAAEIAEAAAEALSIRTASLKVDEYTPRRGSIEAGEFRMRCRFALRFGEIKDDQGETVNRIGVVRQAFNSPFRPFILASTSIGQEGLDFHTYCHAIYHWNLPSNPVDLEQREGRIHRYKGHAIRKSVAARFGLEDLRDRMLGEPDPWKALFDLAQETRPAGASDLVPYWIYETEGGARIERRVPMLPFSREERRLERLKASLAVYRLAFGQPRQEDLIEFLRQMSEEVRGVLDLEELRVSLVPPEVEIDQSLSEELTRFLEAKRSHSRAEEESEFAAGPLARDRYSFLGVVREREGDKEVDIASAIFDWAQEQRLEMSWGQGRSSPSVEFSWRSENVECPLFSLYSTVRSGTRISMPFLAMSGPFEDRDLRVRLLRRIDRVVSWGRRVTDEDADLRPTFRLDAIAAVGDLAAFKTSMEWAVKRLDRWEANS